MKGRITVIFLALYNKNSNPVCPQETNQGLPQNPLYLRHSPFLLIRIF